MTNLMVRLVAIFLLHGTTLLMAQQRVVVGGELNCRMCEIDLISIARLGGPDDSVHYFIDEVVVARNSRGQFLVGPQRPHRSAAITVYDSTGGYVTGFARSGLGPGESARPQTFFLSTGDTVYLLDNAKISVYSPDFRFVRELPSFPPEQKGGSALRLHDGRFAIPAVLRRATASGYPIHILSADGATVTSIGSQSPLIMPGEPYALRRTIAAADGNKIWAGHAAKYEMELWDSSGRLERVVSRQVSWFRPWKVMPTPAGQLEPQLLGLRQDEQGYLWTVVAVPKADAPSVLTGGPFHMDDLLDTVIEVFDPIRGELVASRKFPMFMKGFWSGDLVTSAAQSLSGTPYLEIWQVVLRKPL